MYVLPHRRRTMGPPIATATVRLDYPPWAADFDPYSNGLLLVGGGGGETRSGVKNKIVKIQDHVCSNYADESIIDPY